MKKKNSKIIILIFLIIVIGIITASLMIKDKENKTNSSSSQTQKLNIGTYNWSNYNEEEQEAMELGLDGGQIQFTDEGFNAYIGNGAWLEGKWEYSGDNVICKETKFNTEWSKEPEEVPLEIYFKIKNNSQIEITEIKGEPLTFHLIDMVTGEMTEDIKEEPLIVFKEGNIYSFE